MSKCERCGHVKRSGPLSPLFFAVNNWLLMAFLEHVTPMPGDLWGAKDYWINWHWFMWWACAIGVGIGLAFFVLFTIGWLAGWDREPRRV